VLRCFWRNDCLTSAAGLTYTSLLSMIPLFVIVFSVFGSFPALTGFSLRIQEFVIKNFVPDAISVIEDHFSVFISNAGQSTIYGFIGFFVTAILLIFSIQNAFERIFNSFSRRSVANSLTVFWTLLTGGPLVLGLTLYIQTQVANYFDYVLRDELLSMGLLLMISLMLFAGHAIAKRYLSVRYQRFNFPLWLVIFLFLLSLPFYFTPVLTAALTFLIFLALFLLLPNSYIRTVHASIGAIFTTIIMMPMKSVFSFYLHLARNYTVIYGAVAVVPIFLFWLFLCWVIVLLGAQIIACLPDYDSGFEKEKWFINSDGVYSGRNMLLTAVAVLREIYNISKNGGELVFTELGAILKIPHFHLAPVLRILQDKNYVILGKSGQLLIKRSFDCITPKDLYDDFDIKPGMREFLDVFREADILDRADLLEMEKRRWEKLNIPLNRLFSGEEPVQVHSLPKCT
jgi:membrane protein